MCVLKGMVIKMKKIYLIILFLILLMGGILFIKLFPFGTTKYTIPNTSVVLEIPKLSSYKKEDKNFSVSFKSIRSKLILEKELENIIKKYKIQTCNNKTIYYNEEDNITIIGYNVSHKNIYNIFNIDYHIGKYDNNECSIITDPQKLTYQIKKCPGDRCYGTDTFKYKNEDGNFYNLYYKHSKFLLFNSGMNTMQYLTSMLHSSWMSMQDVIDFLEYKVQNGETEKIVYKEPNSILYKNKDFSLLECNTSSGNKDIYLLNPNFEYEDSYCQ